jgi:hypothetical protein
MDLDMQNRAVIAALEDVSNKIRASFAAPGVVVELPKDSLQKIDGDSAESYAEQLFSLRERERTSTASSLNLCVR